jgi:hypothetical protein
MEMDDARRIRWPPRYHPDRAPVHVCNELEMDAAPDAVWAWLIRAQLWPAWYENASNVSFVSGTPPDLGPATTFRWKTFGVGLESQVLEFVPGERIAWDGRGPGVDVYHAWLIRKTPRGTHVLTEETQYGALARLSHAVLPWRMPKYHQIWLESLSARARSGYPPAA